MALSVEISVWHRVGQGEGGGGGGRAGFVYICSRGDSEEGSTFISPVNWPFILLEQLLMEYNKTHFRQAVPGTLTGQFNAQNRLLQSALVHHQHPLWSGDFCHWKLNL